MRLSQIIPKRNMTMRNMQAQAMMRTREATPIAKDLVRIKRKFHCLAVRHHIYCVFIKLVNIHVPFARDSSTQFANTGAGGPCC